MLVCDFIVWQSSGGSMRSLETAGIKQREQGNKNRFFGKNEKFTKKR